MEKVDITIVGAGVVGLAIAYELSRAYKDILVIEKNASFGEEASSRNSEVIHAGLYYPKESLKAKLCVEGRILLYEFCAKYNIAHKKIGKLIVAVDKSEVRDLEMLLKNARENGVEDLKMLSKKEALVLEPNVYCEQALYSPSTGILDSHSFMKSMYNRFREAGGTAAFNTELKAINKTKDGFELSVEDKREGAFKFFTRLLINCAGLNSDRVCALAGFDKEEYRLKYCKGDYFRVNFAKAKLVRGLVYPVPKPSAGGLGIHATPDLAGSLRLGPDDEYVEKIDYNVNAGKAKIFYESALRFLPFLEPQDLSPDMAGVRPKLQGRGEGFRDFIIKDEQDSGVAGFINLIGIESPGLTASLSIARRVRQLSENYLQSTKRII